MSSIRLLVVEKTGIIKESVLKTWNEEELYKKAGFKTKNGFTMATTWTVKNINKKSYTINVYGKTDGRANQENKYEFPPPIDETLFFGSCLIVNMKDNKPASLTTAEWTCIYEKLYGGFESLGEEDSESDESDESENVPKTKSGYVKDGFIVDDEEGYVVDDEDDEDDEDDDEFVLPTKKTAKRNITKEKTNTIPDNIFAELSNEIDELLESAKELEKEEYI